jgi:hypothetical protein
VAWLTFWLWAFSLAFSDSFFVYNRHSRLPTFTAAWLGSAGILASACSQWTSRRPILAASLWHLVGAIASMCPLVLVSALLSRAPEPWHLSGDDAMGVGIDFLILCALGALSVVLLPVGLALREAIRPTR